MVDCSELEVFVLTYNRSKQLEEMLDSLCNQSAPDFYITVLNNASTDDTAKMVKAKCKEYPHRKITLVTHPKNLGNIGNFKKSQELASRKYTAIFHDDDTIHPEYIERAMALFNEHEDAVLCTGGVKPTYNADCKNWPLLMPAYFLYPAKFGAYFQMMISRCMFQTAVYRTDIYKKVQYHPEKYGKLHDIVFLMDMGKYGETISIVDICGRMGCSGTQDSANLKDGPFPEQLCALSKQILEMSKNQRYIKPSLWNFTCFLYEWACLSRYETWDEFVERLQAAEVFTDVDVMEFTMKPVMDRLNSEMLSWIETLKGCCYHTFSSQRSGLEM